MSRDCLASQPSAWKRSLAAGATLFCFLCFHDALLAHAPKTKLPAECPQPCCAYTLPAVSASRFVSPIAASVNQ